MLAQRLVLQAARRRPHRGVRAAGLRDRRRRHEAHPAHRRDAAVRLLRRLVDRRELHPARAAADRLRTARGRRGERARSSASSSFVVVLFAALVAQTSRWTVFEAEALRDNALNRRALLEEQRIQRGRDPRRATGTLLARSVRGEGRDVQPPLPDAASCSATRSATAYIDIGRYELEQSRNDELTGERDDVGSIIDQLSGREREGDDVRTTLDLDAQRVAFEALGGQRGAVVAIEPATGRIRAMASQPGVRPATPCARDGALKQLDAPTTARRCSTARRRPVPAGLDVQGRHRHRGDRQRASSRRTRTVDGSSPKTISGAPLNNFGNEDFGDIPLTDRADELGEHGLGAGRRRPGQARRCSATWSASASTTASRSTCRSASASAAACTSRARASRS